MTISRATPGSASALPSAAPATPPDASERGLVRILREGVVGGLIAYAAVVLTVAGSDTLRGRPPFFTAARLGMWLFGGGDEPLGVSAWAGPMLAYNGLHIVASLVAGVAAALLVFESERLRGFWYVALMAFVATSIFLLVLGGGLAAEVGDVIDWTTAVLGTTAWLGALVAYLAWSHRRLADLVDDDLQADG